MIKEVQDAVYVIPIRVRDGKKQIALLKYEDGYGKIGGRVDNGETLRQALKREISEELGESAVFLADIALKIDKPYEYKVSEDHVGIRKARNERHFCFVANIPDETELTFCEKREDGAKVVWLNPNSLIDENIIVYPDLRNYYAEQLLPVIHSVS